jgi:hypothetical protein
MKSGLDDLLNRLRRTAPGPLLVRGGLFAAGLVGQLVAWPSELVFGQGAFILLVLAALPVVAPRSRLVFVTIKAPMIGWLIATTAYGEPLVYWRLVLLAAAGYAVHTLAALAAVLPYDTVVSAGVLAGWLLRAGLVMALTVVVALFTLLVPAYLGTSRYLVASLAGLVLMVGLAGYLAALVRRE